jgi:histidine triad (HIT) family protein
VSEDGASEDGASQNGVSQDRASQDRVSQDRVSEDCVFCERLAGRDFWLPVAQTAHSLAALANHQRSPGSLIIVPRRHVVALPDLTRAEALDLFRTVRRVTAAVERAYDPEGMYIWQGGRIPLAHIHARVCPRAEGAPYPFVANTQLALTPLPELHEIAARLTAALN